MARRTQAASTLQRPASPGATRSNQGSARPNMDSRVPTASRAVIHRLPHAVSAWQRAAGNSATNQLVQRSLQIQRMTYPAIKPLAGIKPATEARLAQIAQVAGIVPGDDVSGIFKKLGSYGRSNFKYDSGAESLANALGKNTFNCESLSDLFIVMVLMVKNPEDIATSKVTEPNPIIFKGSLSAGGCSNQVPNVTGRPWVMYSGGHTVASVGGTLYDLTTGLIGGFGNSDYVVGKALGNKQYRFVVDSVSVDLHSNSQVLGGLYGADTVAGTASENP